jgi:hypothetical protein
MDQAVEKVTVVFSRVAERSGAMSDATRCVRSVCPKLYRKVERMGSKDSVIFDN